MALWPLYLAALMILAAAGLILLVLRLRRQEPEGPEAEVMPDLAAAAPGSLVAPAAQQSPQGPVCPVCRSPLMPRAAAGRHILLCSRFPTCNYGSLK